MGRTSEAVGATPLPESTESGLLWRPPDERRVLQLVLATIWLFDAVLQLQPMMFTRQFGIAMIAPQAHGNPSAVAHSITWASRVIAHHSVPADAAFAAIQILIGLGIAWRPTVKMALATSIAWAAVVWWFGEGLGGVASGAAHTFSGAPGAVLIYAVLAVLLWPTDRIAPASSCTAARGVGDRVARPIWVLLWGGLAFFALSGTNRSPDGLRNVVNSLIPGEPRWLATLDRHAADLLGDRGLWVSITLAVVLGAIALSVYMPTRPARVMSAVAVGLALGIWVVGENFGQVFSGSATDPNSGPVLALLAVAYWRRLPAREPAPAPASRLSWEAV